MIALICATALLFFVALFLKIVIDLIKSGSNIGVDKAEQGIGLTSWWNANILNPPNLIGSCSEVKAGPATHIKNGQPIMVFERSQMNNISKPEWSDSFH